MSVPYTSVPAQLLEAVASHLAASATVRDLLGVADAAAARTRIIEIDGPVLETAHLLITAPRFRLRRTAGGMMTGTASLAVIAAVPLTAGDTPAEDFRRACNWHGPLLAHLATLAWPRLAALEDDPPEVLDASDGLGAWCASEFRLELEVLP